MIEKSLNLAEQNENALTRVDENTKINENLILSFTIEIWSKSNVIVDDVFKYYVTNKIANDEIDSELRYILECRQIHVWPMWKEAMSSELDPLEKQKVFRYVA